MPRGRGEERAALTREVRDAFARLTRQGLDPNDAAALALKLAAGIAEWPLDVPAFLGAVQRCKDASLRSGEKLSEHLGVSDAIERVFSSADALNSSFIAPSERRERSDGVGEDDGGDDDSLSSEETNPPLDPATRRVRDALKLDFDELLDVYQAVESLGSLFVGILLASFARLLESLGDGPTAWSRAGHSLIRLVLILLECPALIEPAHFDVLGSLLKLAASLPCSAKDAFVRCVRACYTRERFTRTLAVVQQFVTVRVYESRRHSCVDVALEHATSFLRVLWLANEAGGAERGAETDAAGRPYAFVPLADFRVDAVNGEGFDAREDYRRWRRPDLFTFSFCDFPFVYDQVAKARILQLESAMLQAHVFEHYALGSPFDRADACAVSDLACPYLKLDVRRDCLLADTMRQLAYHVRCGDIRKPLRVRFVGEEGVDEGGVQKEFFQLIAPEVFSKRVGFEWDDETNCCWFAKGKQPWAEYELAGVIVGLAVYNGHVLDLRLPKAAYKKLTGERVGLADLRDVAPWHHNAALCLLRCENEDECASFGFSFSASYVDDVSGETECVDLLPPCGEETRVTMANRTEYVHRYAEWYLVDSVAAQFDAFRVGFERLCSGSCVSMFRSDELESVIVGAPSLDFRALQANCSYEDGLLVDSDLSRWFWDVVHLDLTAHQRRRLLCFVTGCDRAPVAGLGSVRLALSVNGSDDARLPTAHTCFNHLMLPRYSCREVLRERLTTAIENAEGFGLQ